MEDLANNELPSGMTYRQWLVGMALQGLLAGDIEDKLSAEACANAAFRYADAVINKMIAAEYANTSSAPSE
ncbi:TPA: hypothetical protein ACMENN_004419 [Klebsiella variicola subsp. variicola]|uniref:hypothetical protein n=1 Tax=Klebsiella TaxID=570 RepID=UPI0009CFEAEC|nr:MULTISPECIES: hypothetical protein [Klebsiella]HCI5685051.1 hypothetical protein [Klebsiella variicola subsp. variicola]MEC7311826.1 hypothetical protein [Klebsiella pneumoniae]MEC7317113.1 hypothetical protein [Klebsiella pneumoniae]PVZ36176.1 hypothetical protein N438_00958 [Klebsiella sp. GL120222-02]SLY88989.1 Uncharacterised protein [Klebsiella variicola]